MGMIFTEGLTPQNRRRCKLMLGCLNCPSHGVCSDEGALRCNPGFIRRKDTCVPNIQVINNAIKHLKKLQSEQERAYGQFICATELKDEVRPDPEYWTEFMEFSKHLEEVHQFEAGKEQDRRKSRSSKFFTYDELVLKIIDLLQDPDNLFPNIGIISK